MKFFDLFFPRRWPVGPITHNTINSTYLRSPIKLSLSLRSLMEEKRSQESEERMNLSFVFFSLSLIVGGYRRLAAIVLRNKKDKLKEKRNESID